MAKLQGRRNRNTSFGKRQDADDAFRKKKKESGGARSGRGERPERPARPERPGRSSGGSFRGSSYQGGARKFSGGPRRDDRRTGEGRSDDRRRGDRDDRRGGDEKKPFERKSFGKRPFSKKPFEKREGRSFDKPFEKREGGAGTGERRGRSFDKPFEKRERRSFDKKSSGKPYEKKPFKKDKPERRSFVEAKVQSHRDRVDAPDTTEKATAAAQPQGDGLIRLNKFISNSGVCSRREADELIKLGVITVNGTTITEMGYKVKPTDDVRHDGKRLTAEKPVYILLNKPKGFITTTDDPQERNTVMELIAGACKERVYPVGRLDRNTTGLLLLTNDGDLTDKLTHPSFNAKKIYKVELDKPLTKADFQRIIDGVKLEEGNAMVDDLAIVSDDSKTVGIELHIGWNHVVRRIFNALEYDVVKLDRVVYAGLDKKDLKRGQWRFLKNDEIVRLKHFK